MNDSNDFFGSSGNDSRLPAKIAADYFNSAPTPEDEKPTPGHLREDASKWDQFTDGQRRLIVFGVLIAAILVLALLLGIGSSCGGCGLCGGCGSDVSASDVITPVDGQIVTEDGDNVLLPAPVTPADVSQSDTTPADEPAGTPQPEGSEPSEDTDSAQESDVISGSDTAAPVTSTDAPSEDDSEDRQVTQVSPLSACNHEADNEAGSGTTTTHTGFLGFLFGCTGCSDSCSVSISESLSDPSINKDDPERNNLGLLSGSDAEEDIWPQQPDDNAYMSMLSDQLTAVSDSMIRLSELDASLSQYTDPQRVRDNDRFKALAAEMLLWCRGAEEYDASALAGAKAVECHRVSLQLAEHMRGYIEDYPQLITGNTSGTDLVSRSDQINTVMADIVELYSALNNFQPAQAAE